MINLGSITGTVSIGIDGHQPTAVGTFSVPVTTTFDPVTNTATVTAAPHAAIIAAAVAALQDAATQMLASIPTAEVTESPEDETDRAEPASPESEWRKAIADQVRRNCSPSHEAYQKGGDALIYAVADWIEHPPAWSAFEAPTT